MVSKPGTAVGPSAPSTCSVTDAVRSPGFTTTRSRVPLPAGKPAITTDVAGSAVGGSQRAAQRKQHLHQPEQQAAGPLHQRGRHGIGRQVVQRPQRAQQQLVGLGLRDEALLHHLPEDPVSPTQRRVVELGIGAGTRAANLTLTSTDTNAHEDVYVRVLTY